MQHSDDKEERPASVAELCSYWDRAFVRLAYWTILGRAPDPLGEAHYLREIRDGLSKLTILDRLRMSPEGQRREAVLPDLDESLRKHRAATRGITGGLVRLLTGREGNGRRERARRALQNHFAAFYETQPAGSVAPPPPSPNELEVVPTSMPTEGFEDLRRRMVRIEASIKRVEDQLRGSKSSGSPSSKVKRP